MSEIRQLDPKQASAVFAEDPSAVYIDVRTEEEFQAGHAPNAVNIPVLLRHPILQMTPNPDFVAVVQAHYPADRRLVLGCQAGVRSQRAAEMLAEAGYKDLTNMQGGFGGARDMFGRITTPGWVQSGLPVETRVDDTNSYAALRRI